MQQSSDCCFFCLREKPRIFLKVFSLFPHGSLSDDVIRYVEAETATQKESLKMTYMKKIEKVLESGKTTREILRELKKLIKQHDEELRMKYIAQQVKEGCAELREEIKAVGSYFKATTDAWCREIDDYIADKEGEQR